MAVALDASSPIRWSAATATNGATFVSAAFTPPTGSFLVVTIEADTFSGAETSTLAVSGGGWTWTKQVERYATETTAGGQSAIWTAPVGTGASMQVTITRTNATSSSGRVSNTCFVCTGVDNLGTPVDTVTANNEGGSGTNNLTTTSITPGANGFLFATGCEWNALGACTSSDLKGLDSVAGSNHAEYAGAIDVISGWKTCTSGVAVTGNLDAAGTGTAQWKWCQIIVREAAAATKAPPPFFTFQPRRYTIRKYS